MSLRPEAVGPVREEIARIAHAGFRRAIAIFDCAMNWASSTRTAVSQSCFPRRGQPAEAPWRLAVATVLQFAEGLSDRQAADAVRSRIDWKYALALELSDPGFDHTVLSEFRARLVAGQAVDLLFGGAASSR
jgi:transposase